MDKETQQQQLAALCEADRQRGFNLTAAPVSRLILIRLDETTTHEIWDLHHMVLDGLSAFVVTSEVMTIYKALCEKRPFTLPHPRPFRDYVQWLNQVDLDQAKTYWQEQLAAFTHTTTLSLDQNPTQPNQLNAAQGEQILDFPPTFVQLLQPFLRQHRITINTLIQAIWGLLLSVYSGDEDVLFGQTNHGRPVELSGFANMVGLFITTTPVHITVPTEMTVSDWLQQLQSAAVTQRRFEHAPLTQIQSWSAIPHEEPLFNTLLLVQSNPALTAVQNEGTERYEKTNYPITLSVLTNEKDYLRVVLTHNMSRFTKTAVSELLTQFNHLMQTVCTSANKLVAQLPLLPPAAQTKLTTTWNQTAADFDLSLTVPELLHQQAVRTPGKTAVTFANTHLTYQELDQRSNQLAHYLQTIGVTAETHVGVCMQRSLEMVVSLLAVLKAGGAYIPIDPSFPINRINLMLADSKASVLLTQTTLADQMGFEADHLICLDTEWAAIANESDAFLSTAAPAQLAYMIYTSGSTGKPKGVQITHQALTNFLFAMQEKLQLTPADKLLAVTTISFDISGLELYLPLLTGAQIHLADKEMAGDGVALVQALQSCTIMQATPATWRMLLAAGWDISPQLTVLCGGESLSHELATQLVARSEHVWNMYGPTETTIWSTMQQITAATLPDLVVNEIVTIGRPIANTDLYIVDKQLRPVPVGVPGELLIGGTGVGRGYFQRPDLTNEKFISHPFADDGILYHTGDLAAYLPDGKVAFYGRIDHQVKVRGYRIELGEIEHQLVQHDTIQEAVLTTHPDAMGESQLVAYLITTTDSTPDAQALRSFLQIALPDYMIPALFVKLDAFPLTPNGKVNRQALPKPETAVSATANTYLAPRNDTESQLVELWQTVLGVSKIGVEDNFFDLGGHSLLATRLISQVQSKFSVTVPIRRFFENPTIAAFAHILDGEDADQAKPHIPITPVSREDKLPLSYSQMRLWFLEKLGVGGTSGITIPLAVRLQGQLNVSLLTQSVNEVVQRHESLRTQFAEDRGEPYQVILPLLQIAVPVVDLSTVAPEQQDKAVRERILAEMKRPFSLTTPPLIHAMILKLRATEYILCINMHHIISDGWSVGVMAREIGEIYQALVRGEPSPLPPLAIQFADFAVWQQQQLQGDTLQAHLDYWRPHWMTPPTPLALPTKTTAPNGTQFSNGTERMVIPAEVLQELRAMAQKAGASLYMVLLATLNALLVRYTGQTDISIGTYIANRNYQELEPLIGFFLNILVFRTDASGNPSFAELLQRTREVTLGAYAHQDVPFEKLLREFQPDRNIGQALPFQVLLMLQNMPIPTLELPQLTMAPVDLVGENAFANYDLTFVMTEVDQELQGYIEYNAEKFDAEIVAQMRDGFAQLLATVGKAPQTTLSALPLLPPAQEKWLMHEVNKTAADYPQRPLHTLFTEQAARTPGETAVIAENSQLTYQQLDQQANQIANRLIQLGIKPGQRVGLALNRTPTMIAALLGTLKAGAAYVPLDPNYPAQRLQYMIADAEISVLMTESNISSHLPPAPETVTILLVDDPAIRQESNELPSIAVDLASLAYVIYTSGSTGQPKGVQITHRSIVNYAMAAIDHFHITPDDYILQFATINFDAAAEEIYPCLLHGATLVLRHETMLRSPEAFMQACADYGVTLLDLPTAYWHTLVTALADGNLSIPDCLRLIILGGERAWPERLVTWKELAPSHVQIINTYGPTETTTVSTLCPLTGENAPASAIDAPIGRPVANTQVYVLDEAMQPVPLGATGELYIGGNGLALGYLNQPELTAVRFIQNPFAAGRLYKTGDLVRYSSDGQLIFIGRADAQVKLRGFRIELEEIGLALRELDGVETAVIILREDEPGDKRLVAYVVATGDPAINAWRQQLRQTLPEYMLPAHYVMLDALPMTPSRKIDQQALPAPDTTARPELERAYEPPQTMAEEMLADLFIEVTGVKKVGIYDNFFELGGHSLLATQLVARVSEAFEIEFPLRTFFEAPTIAQLAVAVEKILIEHLDTLSEDEVEALLE
ncbi:MAG: amino acid adenylation domain-containing protein [Chloroflexi bacterium]|nr:amino acid adenylation domain-containing protein [Chloroflexota bacterium]